MDMGWCALSVMLRALGLDGKSDGVDDDSLSMVIVNVGRVGVQRSMTLVSGLNTSVSVMDSLSEGVGSGGMDGLLVMGCIVCAWIGSLGSGWRLKASNTWSITSEIVLFRPSWLDDVLVCWVDMML